MKIRIATIAACAVTFALAQGALAQAPSPQQTPKQSVHPVSKKCLGPRPTCIGPACQKAVCDSKTGIWHCVPC
jgi:hypothetical protein